MMEIQWSCLKAVPPGLSAGFACQPVRVGDVYCTTSQQAYKPRSMTTPNLPVHRRAPGSWKVHYTMHTLNKVTTSVSPTQEAIMNKVMIVV